MKKVRWIVAGLAIAFGFFALTSQNSAASAGEGSESSSSQLIFDWVSDEVEAELNCDWFEQCIHIEVIDTSQCPTSMLLEVGFEDLFGRDMGYEAVIVPSPKFTGGHVIEIGSNMRAEVGVFGIYDITCSSSAPTLVGIS